MKATVMLFAALTFTTPVVANAAAGQPQEGKDRCLLYSENCLEQGDTINERIVRLQNEIAKGAKVYASEEISSLRNKLEESQWTLAVLLAGG